MDAQWNAASKNAQGSTENAERGEATSLEPGRRAGRWAPETNRKLCAACNVEKQEAHLSGTQWGKRATAEEKCKDSLTSTGEPERAQLSGSEGRDGSPGEADGSERERAQEIARADALEPGRNGGRAGLEAIRKLRATCHVEEGRAHFSGTQ